MRRLNYPMPSGLVPFGAFGSVADWSRLHSVKGVLWVPVICGWCSLPHEIPAWRLLNRNPHGLHEDCRRRARSHRGTRLLPLGTRVLYDERDPNNYHLIGIQCRGCFALPPEEGGGVLKFAHDSVIAGYVKNWIAVLALIRWTQACDASAWCNLWRLLKGLRLWGELCPDCLKKYGRNREYNRKYTKNEKQENGTEVRFGDEKDGLVEIVYDLCGEPCARKVRWDHAVAQFGEFSDVCPRHQHDRAFQKERMAERLKIQPAAQMNGAEAQPKKRQRGRQRGEKRFDREAFLSDLKAAVLKVWRELKGKAEGLGPGGVTKELVTLELQFRGHTIAASSLKTRLKRDCEVVAEWPAYVFSILKAENEL